MHDGGLAHPVPVLPALQLRHGRDAVPVLRLPKGRGSAPSVGAVRMTVANNDPVGVITGQKANETGITEDRGSA